MQISIKYKLLPITILGILVIGVVFGVIFISTQKSTLESMYAKEISSAKKTFYSLEENDTKMLKAAMTDFMTNDAIKQIFAKKEYSDATSTRDELYAATKDLYAAHKAMGITHFYFHDLNDTIFLRVHQPQTFGDALKRVTYLKSKEANSWGTGIEMGKTAFALRTVSPYYGNITVGSSTENKLLGYLEFGEEIDHFFQILSTQTDNNFAMVIKKQKADGSYYITDKQWADYVKTKNIRDNYADLKDYLVIDATDKSLPQKENPCLDESKISQTSKEGNIFTKYVKDNKTFVCGGFALVDAAGKTLGSVLVSKDVTVQEQASAAAINNLIMITIGLGLVLSLLIIMLTNMIVINPIKKLATAGQKISDGDLSVELPDIKSNDEIRNLSDSMSSLVGAIKFLRGTKK